MKSVPTIGWVGTGVMGEPCCRHLMVAGYPLVFYTRTRERATALEAEGARWCDSPSEVAGAADVIFTMVGSPDEVDQVYFGNQGLFVRVRKGHILVDMGTTPPSMNAEIVSVASEIGAEVVDAPVSGGDVGARNGALSIMAGGDEGVIDSLMPVFGHLGEARRMGPSGSGQHTKMCNQITVAGTMIGVCEALLYSQRCGVDEERLVEVISKGAAACWTLENLAPRINNDDLEPGFMVDHFVKDLGIALQEASTLGLELPGLKLATELYRRLQSSGHGKRGTQALILALREINE